MESCAMRGKWVLQNRARTVRLSASTSFPNWDGGLSPKTGRASAYIQSWRKATVPVGTCPDCEAEVHVALDADKGDTITCEECGSPLEVVGLDPVELDIAEEDLEDDSDDDEEDEEY